ncbi:TetR family transcriptional regulator C-terminal domain-containing protein [Phytohabitans rumicis]|uniref:BetI-type transcriptional repressor C-terminal domain-containing protein n=1 Tax=Phytohabitans rumicis TaxID=1076125 RepID=A0A6V8L9J9_9ACTN|nr:hypothetical protein Prum_048810 [Phytohabitans rumicis]
MLGKANEMFAEIAEEEPPLSVADAMERAFEFVDGESGPDGALRIALQVWAESLRDPVLHEFVKEKYVQFRTHFAAIARRAQQAGDLPPDADVEAIGAALYGMVPGFALQRMLADGPDHKAYAAAVRLLITP